MKKRIFVVLITALLLAGCSGPAHPQEPAAFPAPSAEAEPAAAAPVPTEAPAGEADFVPNAVDLYFPANPTTGFVWTAKVEDPGIAELDEKYFADGELGTVGAGGVQWYRIRGVSEGVTSVTFSYARPWEDAPRTSYVYRLQVDARGSVLIWGVEVDGA